MTQVQQAQIPLNRDKNQRRPRFIVSMADRQLTALTRATLLLVVKDGLVHRLRKKLEEHEAALSKQMVEEGGYHPYRWRKIEVLETQVERLKGAVAALRWAVGESEEIDLEMPGYLDVAAQVSAYKHDLGGAVKSHDELRAALDQSKAEYRGGPFHHHWERGQDDDC